jgi:hypothetical protein
LTTGTADRRHGFVHQVEPAYQMVSRIGHEESLCIEEEKSLRAGERDLCKASILRAPHSCARNSHNVCPVALGARNDHPVMARVGNGEQTVRASRNLAGKS